MTLSILQWLTLLLIAAAIVLVMWRFLRGPSAADRIVAADTLAVVATATIAFLALLFGRALYLDLALLLGTLAFVGVVALARVILQRVEIDTEVEGVGR